MTSCITAPINAVVKHPIWLNDEICCYLTIGDKAVDTVLNRLQNLTCTWSVEDFYKMYSKPGTKLIFHALSEHPSEYYYNVSESLDVLNRLLLHQFHHDCELVEMFVTSLYNIVERKVPKMNTLVILGPQCSGKSYFFDFLCAYFLNVGKLCTANRYNMFAFQDADSRRIILWNEPNYHDDYIDLLKELLGGDTTNVTVKYKRECPISRTPIIILGNEKKSFMNNTVFRNRYQCFHWVQADFLKDELRKPHPLALYFLFRKYNLVATPPDYVGDIKAIEFFDNNMFKDI